MNLRSQEWLLLYNTHLVACKETCQWQEWGAKNIVQALVSKTKDELPRMCCKVQLKIGGFKNSKFIKVPI